MAGIGISRAGMSSILLLICLFLSFSEARDLLIGGKADAWKVPASDADSLNHWAQKSRFIIGDSLVWEYDAKDSVLEVTGKDYANCNTTSPIESYTGGSTKVKLSRSGKYYFISGGAGHCEKGQKVLIVVISERHHNMKISPAPSPAEVEAPAIAPAPTSGAGSLSGGFLVAALGALLALLEK